MPKRKRKPPRRRKSSRKSVPASPRPRVPASSSPEPDPVKKGRLLREAHLLGKIKSKQGLTPKEQAELERYESERGGGPGPVPSGAPVLVSSESQIAEVYGVGVRTAQLWKAEPGFPSPAAPYILALIGPWVRARWQSEAQPASGSGSDQARARRLNAMAEQAEMDLKQRRGALLSRDDVLATFQEFSQAVKAAAEAFVQANPEAVKEFHRLIEIQRRDLALRYPQPTPSEPAAPTPPTPSAGEPHALNQSD